MHWCPFLWGALHDSLIGWPFSLLSFDYYTSCALLHGCPRLPCIVWHILGQPFHCDQCLSHFLSEASLLLAAVPISQWVFIPNRVNQHGVDNYLDNETFCGLAGFNTILANVQSVSLLLKVFSTVFHWSFDLFAQCLLHPVFSAYGLSKRSLRNQNKHRKS